MPVVAVGMIVGLYIFALQISPDMRQLSEPGTILMLNVFMGFTCSGLLCMFSKPRPRKINVEEIIKETEPIGKA